MTFTDAEYREFSDRVYRLDPKEKNKYAPDMKEGSLVKVKDKEYKIVKIQENSKTDGMQSMAVAPVDKNGNVDTSQIMIAYAGTNPKDWNDLETDLRTVGGFYDKSASPGFSMSSSEGRVAGQLNSAIAFANSVKNDYKDATISTTGHSLGEFLALYIAAENQWKNVGFNGPDPYELLSSDAKDWIKNNPGMLTNFRNRADIICNLMGNGTDAEIKISLNMGIQSLGTYHDLSKWTFDENGNLIIPKNNYNDKATRQQAERLLMADFVMSIYALSVLEKKLSASGGSLTANEKLYLDASQANLIVSTASKSLKMTMTNVIKVYQDAITNAEKVWSDCQSKARNVAPDLSEGEIEIALSAVGATKSSIVNEPCEKFRNKINKAKKIGETFDDLASEIKTKIDQVVQQDQDLARQISTS